MTITSLQKKIVSYAAVMAAVVALLGYAGLSLPTPVWADEFNALKGEVYKDQLLRARKELRSVKMEEYQLLQKKEVVPPFLVDEKLELEDQVKDLEAKVEKLESK